MMHKILVVLMFFSLLISCSEENVEPEFPTLSQKELDKFLTQETISLSYNNTVWKMSIDDMQANSTNVFINWPVKDSIGLISGLAGNNDDRSFSLYAGAVPFNDDIDVSVDIGLIYGDNDYGDTLYIKYIYIYFIYSVSP